MSDLFKDIYNEKFIDKVSVSIKKYHNSFDTKSFKKLVFDENWKSKELKERMRHITICLNSFLPENYLESLSIIKKVAVDFGEDFNFAPMVFPDFVEYYGLEYNESIDALEHFTRYSSSEFAVRPYILKNQKLLMDKMLEWSKSENHHVRRFASEGCRPRLPWAIAIPSLKKDPTPIIPILENLKDDSELYVRRSVANNLNDISKDNPDVVIALAIKWKGINKNVDWVVKHACRTLLKQGNPVILELFGFKPPKNIEVKNFKVQKEVQIGKDLNFEFDINTTDCSLGKLRLEYAINFMKANGKQSRKVFKISESEINKNIKHINKKQSFKIITTRKYYEGEHGIVVIVNGVDKYIDSFNVIK